MKNGLLILRKCTTYDAWLKRFIEICNKLNFLKICCIQDVKVLYTYSSMKRNNLIWPDFGCFFRKQNNWNTEMKVVPPNYWQFYSETSSKIYEVTSRILVELRESPRVFKLNSSSRSIYISEAKIKALFYFLIRNTHFGMISEPAGVPA